MRFDCRTALFMPASNERAMDKGSTIQADAIIVDLEDSVAPVMKATARGSAVQAFQSKDYGYRLRVLRINAADSLWHLDDIDAAAQCRPAAVVLPKVEHEGQVAELSALMDDKPELADTRIWAMMESPMAVVNAATIAACSRTFPRLQSFLIGNNDMARESNMPVQSDRTHLLPWIMSILAAARAFRLGALDGVYNDFKDIDGFRQECRQAAAMGMDGKTLIHPSQAAICNEVFSPTAQEINHSRQVVEAFELPQNADKGAIAINGEMVERLHLAMAKAVLERVQRFDNRS